MVVSCSTSGAKEDRQYLIQLKEIESWSRRKWSDCRSFEAEPDYSKEKYFVTFPYPYMNGKLHIGHAFTLSKAEFSASFERLRGKNCLFPLGFHVSGTPILACADKLKKEIDQFGMPPKFPVENIEEKISEISVTDIEHKLSNVDKSKKTKSVAKSGNAPKYQWQIMKSLLPGMSDEDIAEFADYRKWLEYFPQQTIADVSKLGLKIDWRRSFITSQINPYYNSLIQWQFNRLKEKNRIKYGKRYAIFSKKMNQTVMDHDLSAGEGVLPQMYTVIKLRVKEFSSSPTLTKIISDRKIAKNNSIFLLCATLRPETLHGQTNCWVNPEINYTIHSFHDTRLNEEVLMICVERAGINFSLQEQEMTPVTEIKGQELICLPLEAPLSPYSTIYALPMSSVNANMGTGIVTSVPSDSPDDFATLRDLKNKKESRLKFKIDDDMVLPFDPIPIIVIPGIGTNAAEKACAKFKVQSHKDTVNLRLAKEEVYLKGFYDGILTVGKYKGKIIKDVKKNIQDELIEAGQAMLYYEPLSKVVSRLGDECYVALVYQWYIEYSNEEWKDEVRALIEKHLKFYDDETKNRLLSVIGWLQDHACSRQYGIGTPLPFDESGSLIESLSDSTIYMAYYCISHLLQGDIKGSKKGLSNIDHELINDDFWDCLFNGNSESLERCLVPHQELLSIRKEFLYWYPMDMRVSGKDLLSNHLAFMLYNHACLFDHKFAPKSLRVNGFMLLDNEKMSKSTGNFLTLDEATSRYGADCTRFSLADAGDFVSDANFVTSIADGAVAKLMNFKELIDAVYGNGIVTRQENSPLNFIDECFESTVAHQLNQSYINYEKMLYKGSLKWCFHEMMILKSQYKNYCRKLKIKMHQKCLEGFIKRVLIALSPICPHFTEFMWNKIGFSTLIIDQRWDITKPTFEDIQRVSIFAYPSEFTTKSRAKITKAKQKVTGIEVLIQQRYNEVQLKLIKSLNEILIESDFMHSTIDSDEFSLDLQRKLTDLVMKKYYGPVQNSDKKTEGIYRSFLHFVIDQQKFLILNHIQISEDPFIDIMKCLNDTSEYVRVSLNLEKVSLKFLSEDDPVVASDFKLFCNPKVRFLYD